MKKKYLVIKTEWYTQFGARPLIGMVTIYNGYMVKTYIGSCSGENAHKDAQEIVLNGAKYREYTPRAWKDNGGWLPSEKGMRDEIHG